jgi:site-specific recombinase XerD
LTGLEVGKLIAATKGTRNEARDRGLLLLMFRRGLRVSEACRLKLGQVDLQSRVLHITRLKHGLSTTQPLRGDELKAIGAWLKQRTPHLRVEPRVTVALHPLDQHRQRCLQPLAADAIGRPHTTALGLAQSLVIDPRARPRTNAQWNTRSACLR